VSLTLICASLNVTLYILENQLGSWFLGNH